MSIRMTCRDCRAGFLISDDLLGRNVACPKCGVEQPAPAVALAEGSPSVPQGSVFVPSAEEPRPRRGRRAAWLALLLVPLLAVAGIVAWPRIREWLHPTPPDPIEVAAGAYLQALAKGDAAAAARLGTVEPPGIRSFREVRHVPPHDRTLKGSFAPIAALHTRIGQKFTYDPEIGRFTPKNALGPAAETLDALHEAKAEHDEIYKKMESAKPDDMFDAAEGLLKMYNTIATEVLPPKKIIPTYKQLVDDAKPRLPGPEEELALDYADHRETWDALLGRPFPTLKADGPFVLDRAEVTARVTDKLASLGDPPTKLRLTLTRFRLEGIDTGWKVTDARREGQPGTAEPERSASGSKHDEPSPSAH